MVSKWTFIKPELTFFHLKNIVTLLEEHYFSIQLLPVFEIMKLYGRTVLEDKKIEEMYNLKKARLLMNLGLKQESETLKQQLHNDSYKLSEEEKKVNLEKIKAMKDP